jgi:hypothetical protein
VRLLELAPAESALRSERPLAVSAREWALRSVVLAVRWEAWAARQAAAEVRQVVVGLAQELLSVPVTPEQAPASAPELVVSVQVPERALIRAV